MGKAYQGSNKPKVLLVSNEHHFMRHNNKYYTKLAFPYNLWEEYLERFDRVVVIARASEIKKAKEDWMRADGPNVEFYPIHNYLGLCQFLLSWPLVLWQIWKSVAKSGANCYLLRQGAVADIIWVYLVARGKRYAFEMPGPGGKSLGLMRSLRWFGIGKIIGFFSHLLNRWQVRNAICATYVSEHVRRLYPTRHPKREWVFSGVRLLPELITQPRDASMFQGPPFRFVWIGRMEPEKGVDTLLHALSRLSQLGVSNWYADIIGEGRDETMLRTLSEELGLSDRVKFAGHVKWGPELFAYLDRAHLFILPSLTEGMPRALIEAMARGLPAVGSRVGGVPELLADECLVAPGNCDELAQKIKTLITDKTLLAEMSRRNFARALEYRLEVTAARKRAFWDCIIRETGAAKSRQSF